MPAPQSHQRYLAIVEDIRERVRGVPDVKLTLEQMAGEAGVSPARLHQVFQLVQGESYGSYTRRAKLEYAIGLMRAFPSWSCTRIAYEAGYSESSEFSRSFKREHGVAPSAWDRVQPLNRIVLPDANSEQSPTHDRRAQNPVFPDQAPTTSSLVTTRTRAAEAVAVFAVKNPTEPNQLPAAFDQFEAFLSAEGQITPDRRFMGLSYDSNLDTKPDLIRFELAYPVDDKVVAKRKIVVRTFPRTQVAVLPCRGGVKDFVAAWDYLLRGYLPASPWRFGQGPHLEIYYNDPRAFDMAYWDMDCVIPIQRKEEGLDDWTDRKS
jgi:AraC family transcriptional regulator